MTDSGAVTAHDDVQMAIADWTFRNYNGEPIYDLDPIWGQALLAAVQDGGPAGNLGGVSELPGDYLYKNRIDGLPEGWSD